jgi:membrane protein YdbS with pleckstrin-like domain
MATPPNSERLICPSCFAKFVSSKTVKLPDSTQVTCSTCKTRFPLAHGRRKDHQIETNEVPEQPTEALDLPRTVLDSLPPPMDYNASGDRVFEYEPNAGHFESETPFSVRSKGFATEVAEAIRPNIGVIPIDISEILDPKEILFASHPSNTAKNLTRFVMLLAMCPFLVIMIFQVYYLLTWSFSISLLLGILIELIALTIPFLLLHLSWKNTFYVIARDKIVVRAGIFNRAIKIIWVKNIQEISINSGVVDRWLNLNTIHFSTASSGIGGILFGWIPGSTLGGIFFRHVELNKVLRALKSAEL